MSGFAGYSETGQGGEERGPASFAFSPGNAPQARASGQATQLRAGQVKPKDTYGVAIAPAAPVDRTLEGIVQFADKAFGKQLDELRQANFLKGMQQAASGEALTDIINEQPWYTKIFGPSGAADGARAYTVQAGVASWANQQEKDMAELRKQSPDAIPAYLNKTVNDLKTGDTATDVMMGMQIMKDAPTLMKVHARENYKYQQEQSVQARYRALDSAATSLQIASAADPGMYTPEEREGRVQSLYQALVLKPGENQESQQATLKAFVQAQGQQGNFHVLNRMVDDGIFNDLRPDDQATVMRSVRTAMLQQASDMGDVYGEQIFDISAKARLGMISANEVREAHTAINDKNRSLTGNPMDVVKRSTIASDSWSAMQYVLAADREAAKAAAKADVEEPTYDNLRNYLKTGGTSKGAINAEYKPHIVDTVLKEMFDEAKTPEEKAKVLVRDAVGGHANKFIVEDLSKKILGAPKDHVTDDFLESSALMGVLLKANGHAAVAEYFPGNSARLLAAFQAELGGRDPAKYGDAALQIANTKVRNEGGYRYAKGEEAAVKDFAAVELEKNAWYKSRTFNLTPHAMQTITNGMADDYGSNKSSMNPTMWAPAAFASTKAKGLEVVGDHAWFVDPNRPRILEYFNSKTTPDKAPVTELELGQGLNRALLDRIESVTNKSPDDVAVYRIADQNGVAYFQAQVLVGGTQMDPIFISSDDIMAGINANYKAKRPTSWEAGPKLVYSDKQFRSPAPSAPAAEWKVYREYQAEQRNKQKGK